jgi:hypothetical protein
MMESDFETNLEDSPEVAAEIKTLVARFMRSACLNVPKPLTTREVNLVRAMSLPIGKMFREVNKLRSLLAITEERQRQEARARGGVDEERVG